MSPPVALLRAVAEVLAGRIALSPDIDHELALNRLAEEPNAADILSAREFEVLSLLLAERSTDEIAGLLNLSPKTVANLHSLIKSKLGVTSDIELVRLALREGLMALKAG
jgi:DNA-binding NarL/FixJ family response regulator